MKNLTLSIPSPCSASWSSFTPTQNGGFCSSCSTNVVDFTKMSEAEVIAFLKNQSSATCGRFRTDQLKTYATLPVAQLHTGSALFKAGLLSLLVAALGQPTFANHLEKPKVETSRHTGHKKIITEVSNADHVVRGRVLSEDDNTPLAGVNVYLKDMTAGVATDADGRFEFPRKLKEGDVLVFSFIGMATKKYVVKAEPQVGIEIRMTYDTCVVMGKVALTEEYREPSGLAKWWNKVKHVF